MMYIKQRITSLLETIKKLPLWIKIVAISILSVLFIHVFMILQSKTVQFLYDKNYTCVQQFTFLPNLYKPTNKNTSFNIIYEDITKIGNIQLFSSKTCFKAKKAPQIGETKVSSGLFGSWFGKTTLNIHVSEPPSLDISLLSQPISTLRPLSIALSSPDLIFSYQLIIDKKIVPCQAQGLMANCDINFLHLLQNHSYDLEINRMFDNKKILTLIQRSIMTVSATSIISSLIDQNQIIYDNPKTFTFEFDKDVIKSNILLEKIDADHRTPVETTVNFDNRVVSVTIKDDLLRDASYEFSIDQLESKDGSTLDNPYKLNFFMSDGPVVVSINVNSTGLPLTETIILTFDQDLSSNQDIGNFVSTNGFPTTITRSNNQVFIDYLDAPVCTNLNITVAAGIQSNYGITQNDSKFYTMRTLCYSVSTIGYSVEGRPILAYIFGDGSKKMLFVGSIHGNELSSKYLMDAWVEELGANVFNIPSDKQVIVIPTINPDGVAMNRRNNSNNVDLNRNFPASDWQTDIVTPSNQPIANGGGVSPLSEPESRAIANLTIQLHPRLTMSFHSIAGYVIANEAEDSSYLASIYAQMTGYSNVTGLQGNFSYPITGTYDSWIFETIGSAGILVELSSNTNAQFSRNQAALWAMLRS